MADGGKVSNVLLVVLDTVRKDHLSVYGYHEPTTPTLEAFAEEARVFEQAVTQAPWTLPAHASLFTGQYPSEHGATQENPYLRGATTLAESVAASGYETACYSSNAWITPYTNLTAGFERRDNFFQALPREFLSGPLSRAWRALNDSDRMRGVADRLVQVGTRVHERFAATREGETKTPAAVDRTIEFVDGADDFFAFVNLMDAHMPYHPPAEHAERFVPGVDADDVCQNATDFNAGARDVDDAEWAAIRGLYDAEIRHMDAELERLFAHLRATGRWENTTVIVAADHGELHGEHGLYGHEFAVYEPLVNVPLLVKPAYGDTKGEGGAKVGRDVKADGDPSRRGLEPGRDRETTVELLDLYHTILDAADADGEGVPFDPRRSLFRPEYRDFGASVGPLDRGDLAFVEYHRPVVELRQLESRASAAGRSLARDSRFYSRMAAVRRPDAKLVHNTRIRDEGYLLDEDPHELANVAGDDARIDDLAAALSAFGEAVDGDWAPGGELDLDGRQTGAPRSDRRTGGESKGDARPGGGARPGGDPSGGPTADDILTDMDRETRARLRDLGYLE